MNTWLNFMQHVVAWIERVTTESNLWRLMAALAILVLGWIAMEGVFRIVGRRLETMLAKKELRTEAWSIKAFLPALRLAATALLLALTEPFLLVSDMLIKTLHAVEVLLLILAGLTIIYLLVERLDRLRQAFPDNLQDKFPAESLDRLKSFLRVTALIGAAAAFIYSQRGFLPQQVWQFALWRYLVIAAVIFLVYLAIRQIGSFLTNMTIVLRATNENVRMRMILEAARWPVHLLLITAAIYVTKEVVVLSPAPDRVADAVVGVLTTLAVIFFLYHLIELLVLELGRFAQREDNLLDQTFVQIMRLIARIVVIAVGGIYLIRAISGKPLSALLAGLGIGGIAVALAAQDTLKNFFGSIMIMLDKPFSVGQRITIEGFDGTVEEIGFRSTRVRTLTGHLVTVPNEKMAANSIENIGRRPFIRRLTNITITYDTPPDKVEKAVDIIREILADHEGMHPDYPPRVYFNEFNDTSLNIMMIYWYHPADYWGYCEFSERVNMQIMRRFEEESIEFAFPTTTTYLAQDNRRPLHFSISGDTQPLIQGGGHTEKK